MSGEVLRAPLMKEPRFAVVPPSNPPFKKQITLQTTSDAFVYLSEITTHFGYDYFFLSRQPEIDSTDSNNDIVSTNFPLFIVENLVADAVISDWSVVKRSQRTLAPFRWSSTDGITPISDLIKGPADFQPYSATAADDFMTQRLKLKWAHCLRIPTIENRALLLLLMSTSEKETSFDPSITLLTFQLCDHLSILNKQNSRKQHSDLSDRELECLRWAAAGKTSGEIAIIVELSEHTVNHYLNSSCKKLDCVNRTQSVAKALRQNLI